MKLPHFVTTLTVLPIVAQAATVIDANNATFTLSGTTTVKEGNLAVFTGAGRWSVANGQIVGSDRIATTVTTPNPADFYFNYTGAALGAPTADLPVATNRYVEIAYELGGDWTAPDQVPPLL